MVFVLSGRNSIADQYLAELRDVSVQQDRLRFRTNLQRLGAIMAYEISKTLDFTDSFVETPLQKCPVRKLSSHPVLISILRAGLPFFNGFVEVFDKADCEFIGAYRDENTDGFKINLDYIATTSTDNRTVIIVDPMLATGSSICDAFSTLLKAGTPAHVHFASVIAAPEGITKLENEIKVPCSIWTGAIDERLNEKYYIVPGLGDAGDLSFGPKI